MDNVGNRHVLTETLVAVPNLTDGTFLKNNGQVVMEAEHFSGRSGSAEYDWLLKTSQSGYTGTSYLQALPDLDIPLVGSTAALTANATAAYPIQFTTPGTYTLWTRSNAPNAAGDSLYVSLDGQLVEVTGADPGERSSGY